MIQVESLYRYPLEGGLPEELETVELDQHGIVGDGWLVAASFVDGSYTAIDPDMNPRLGRVTAEAGGPRDADWKLGLPMDIGERSVSISDISGAIVVVNIGGEGIPCYRAPASANFVAREYFDNPQASFFLKSRLWRETPPGGFQREPSPLRITPITTDRTLFRPNIVLSGLDSFEWGKHSGGRVRIGGAVANICGIQLGKIAEDCMSVLAMRILPILNGETEAVTTITVGDTMEVIA